MRGQPAAGALAARLTATGSRARHDDGRVGPEVHGIPQLDRAKVCGQVLLEPRLAKEVVRPFKGDDCQGVAGRRPGLVTVPGPHEEVQEEPTRDQRKLQSRLGDADAKEATAAGMCRWPEHLLLPGTGLEHRHRTASRDSTQPRRVTSAMAAVRRLQAHPDLGEFRIHARLAQMGISLSPRTCGRIMAHNRHLGLPRPADPLPDDAREMPFGAT